MTLRDGFVGLTEKLTALVCFTIFLRGTVPTLGAGI